MTVTSEVRWRAQAEITPHGVGNPLMPPRRSRLRMKLQLSLVACDVVVLGAAIALAGYIWAGGRIGMNTTQIMAVFVPFYVLAALNCGAFAADVLGDRRRGAEMAVRSVLLACAGVVLAAFFLKAGEQISRMTLVIGGVLGALFIGMARGVIHALVRRWCGADLYSEVLVIDESEIAPPPGVFVMDAKSVGLRCDLRDPLMLDRIGRVLAHADRVVIACPAERRRDWAMMLKGANVDAHIIHADLKALGPLGTDNFAGHATVKVAAGPLTLRQRFLKRGFDVVLAASTLAVLSPLFVLVALAIRLDSSGPILFVQTRVGRGNRLFGIYKFRSMRTETSDADGNRSTHRYDDRITRVGRFIRSTSIDELPQLLNILRGDMSFVGPRPHALGSLAGNLLFWEIDDRYWHRHACMPGLTGLAQIRGYRGATHQELDLTNRLQADLEYLSGWTVLRDISILLATLKVVVHRNAY
jgi:lipopolysaccharide/colanic/teichoic acid biosynthesis glycosyltransferase